MGKASSFKVLMLSKMQKSLKLKCPVVTEYKRRKEKSVKDL